jgi:hypothetical protein
MEDSQPPMADGTMPLGDYDTINPDLAQFDYRNARRQFLDSQKTLVDVS